MKAGSRYHCARSLKHTCACRPGYYMHLSSDTSLYAASHMTADASASMHVCSRICGCRIHVNPSCAPPQRGSALTGARQAQVAQPPPRTVALQSLIFSAFGRFRSQWDKDCTWSERKGGGEGRVSGSWRGPQALTTPEIRRWRAPRGRSPAGGRWGKCGEGFAMRLSCAASVPDLRG